MLSACTGTLHRSFAANGAAQNDKHSSAIRTPIDDLRLTTDDALEDS